MHFLFPSDTLDPRSPDDFFCEQLAALKEVGFSTSLFPEEVFLEERRLKGIPPGSQVVYRGWMLTANEYGRLVQAIETAGGIPYISQAEYLTGHHLPNWYRLIPDLTPETRVYPVEADLVTVLKELGWETFFVKDYVKSLKTSLGSVIHEPSRINEVLAEMVAYRGQIEGGVCVRRVEDFIPDTERRYFVIRGRPFGADGTSQVPQIVDECAKRIPSKFFSIDVIQRRDGVMRVVEIGDGQVSDLVGWSPATFAQVWLKQQA
jgi:hypothetical protein